MLTYTNHIIHKYKYTNLQIQQIQNTNRQIQRKTADSQAVARYQTEEAESALLCYADVGIPRIKPTTHKEAQKIIFFVSNPE